MPGSKANELEIQSYGHNYKALELDMEFQETDSCVCASSLRNGYMYMYANNRIKKSS